MGDWFRTTGDSIHIDIKAFPGACKNEFTGVRDSRLCVRLAAAPQDGKANACLREFLAKSLECAKRDISFIKGEKSRLKTLSAPKVCYEKLKEIAAASSGKIK